LFGIVDNFVAAKASEFNTFPQGKGSARQRVLFKASKLHAFFPNFNEL
jgi:hypothetical protein